MPHVINGIGTWYYGRRNLVVRQGRCGSCGAETRLSSYDTTLFLVVVFIPVIPLGRKRILDDCPSCRKHRYLSLKEWSELKEKALAETADRSRAAPEDLDLAVAAVQAFLEFEEPERFRAFAEEHRRGFRDNPEWLNFLDTNGMALPYVEFGSAEPGIKLVYEGEDYWYCRTLPLKGYGAVMARYIRSLESEGKKPLLARFGMRIYIYATGVTPIGAGKPPGASPGWSETRFLRETGFLNVGL